MSERGWHRFHAPLASSDEDDLTARGVLSDRGGLGIAYAGSIAIVVLMGVASAAGLAFRASVYPTDELTRAFVPNDVVNLAIGVPALLVPMWAAYRGRAIGLVCWIGALFFVLYDYLIYLLAMPLGAAYVADLALVAASAYLAVFMLRAVDRAAMCGSIEAAVPVRTCAGLLAGLGALFCLRAIGVLAGGIGGTSAVSETDLAVTASDLLVMPAWLAAGVLLWRRRPTGFVLGPALLYQACLLFGALVAVLLARPAVSDAAPAVGDAIFVAVMGCVCFVPFAIVVRRATRLQESAASG